MLDLTPDEWIAIRLSLKIAIVATIVALPFGIAVAWVLARKNFWGKTLIDGVVHLPLVLPPVVTGYLLLISFGRRGLIGAFLADHFGIVFSFRWTGAALACGIMGFRCWCARSGLRSKRSTGGWKIAATLGANRIQSSSPSRPLALPGLTRASCSALPRRSASSAPPSPSSPTFQARRRPSRPRSTPSPRSRRRRRRPPGAGRS
jgi:molybdate transport system permease protein